METKYMLTANTLASLKLNLNPKHGITFFSSDDDMMMLSLDLWIQRCQRYAKTKMELLILFDLAFITTVQQYIINTHTTK